MPELPEVHRVLLTLEPYLVGRRIDQALLRRPDYCRPPPGSRRATPQDLLEGATIDRLDRRGKQLAIIATDGRTLCVHLGMSGQVLFRPGATTEKPLARQVAARQPHVHALWRLGSDLLLIRDPRRFGGLWAFRTPAELQEHRWSLLGPDALSVSRDALETATTRSSRPIKSLLLDQEALAGVGNIYADEALFLARIHPERAARDLKPKEITSLADAVRTVLADSIRAGGTSLRDYVDADGNPGGNAGRLRVYGREGLPCTRCGRPLSKLTVAQRTTVYCSRCQRLPTRTSDAA